MSFKLTNPPKTISDYISQVISERVATKQELMQAAAEEKERQRKTAAKLAREKKETLKEQDVAPAQATPAPVPSANDEDKEALRSGEVEVADIVEKLNAIRAGRSFRDEKIAAELEKYFNNLDKAERTALLAYLKGIQEIVSGVGDGDKAVEPSDPDPGVKMEKETQKKVVHVKPTIIYKSGTQDSAKEKSVEDTTAPAPIKPKTK